MELDLEVLSPWIEAYFFADFILRISEMIVDEH